MSLVRRIKIAKLLNKPLSIRDEKLIKGFENNFKKLTVYHNTKDYFSRKQDSYLYIDNRGIIMFEKNFLNKRLFIRNIHFTYGYESDYVNYVFNRVFGDEISNFYKVGIIQNPLTFIKWKHIQREFKKDKTFFE